MSDKIRKTDSMEKPEMEEPQCSKDSEQETVQTEEDKGSRQKRRPSSPSQVSMKSSDTVQCSSGKRPQRASATPDNVSMKSSDSDSGIEPVYFCQGEHQKLTGVRKSSPTPDNLSVKSSDSMIQPLHFRQGEQSQHRVRKSSPTPDHLSVKSSDSMIQPLHFRQDEQSQHRVRKSSPTPDHLSVKSSDSMIQPLHFRQDEQSQHRVRKSSPTPDNLSVKSSDSMIQPLHFRQGEQSQHRVRKSSPTPDHLSVKSSDSMIQPLHFRQGEQSQHRVRKSSPTPDHLSVKSSDSMIQPLHFRQGEQSQHRVQKSSPTPDHLSVKSSDSMIQPLHFRQGEQSQHSKIHKEEVMETGDVEPRVCQEHRKNVVMFCKTDQAPICKDCALEKHREHKKQYTKIKTVPGTLITLQNILHKMTASEFREFKRNLGYEYPECFETLEADCSPQDVAERMMEGFAEDDVLRVTIQLASVKPISKCQEKIKEKLRRKFRHIHEGLALPKTQVVLHDIYTKLYITEGEIDAVGEEHEVRIIEKAAKNGSTQETPVNITDIFRSAGNGIRLVLTKGLAGIGKTVSVQKFMLDWAENTANQDIDLILPLFFRDLNLEKEACSLMALMQRYFPELKNIETIENGIRILLVLDGLDECRIQLDFQNTRKCCDIMEPISMDVLLTNLINGDLLPNALLWITSRPAATNQIPSECIQRVTEVRGFNDEQKEEYFQKKCTDPQMASTIISHVKSSRSMHIMCHIPIFCWLTATVLDVLIKNSEIGEVPKNQTQLYIHYIFIQTGLKNRKYQKAINEDLRKLTPSDKKMILNLAKLAFHGMQKKTLIFYEADLDECGLDISEASEFSSLCTQLFREEFGLYKERVFCFLHLSVQEHLAAVHVLCQFLNEGINILASHGSGYTRQKTTLTDVLKSAVDMTLQNKLGHFDQFLRFLLGLCTDCSRKLLRGLFHQLENESFQKDEIVQFIKKKIHEEDRTGTETINLFHCLIEMGENYLVKEIQESLRSGTLCDKTLNPGQCSALAFVLLMSEDIMEVFDLRSYKTDASSRLRLLPIIRASKKAILCECELSEKACKIVASALCTANCPVRELDLSHNKIEDKGLGHLCKGLKSPHSQLQILRLAGCSITDKSCEQLASALVKSNLQELDLSLNKLTDAGVRILEDWFNSVNCKVQILKLAQCHLTKGYCKHLAEEVASTRQIFLDLNGNDLED